MPPGGPRNATIVHDPWDDLQADVIDAPEGGELMPVTMITSMRRSPRIPRMTFRMVKSIHLRARRRCW
jgi:hypothetical protein